ncbi:hypothetical protein TWF106_002463 [Orbilia oligospora]|uniref:Uncharacterized protein n=1 Tax=Orbilia oligospora TaxID=2813651 RepID=A0A7C8Q8V0_ORBOL|nr:hypothetical protein TWF106_002463 [Orbilia oligospora]KAF3205177.1 hypothetical protein TWF679_009400 [Orbilia oligospora]
MKNKNKSQLLRSNSSVTTSLLLSSTLFLLILQINLTTAAAVNTYAKSPLEPRISDYLLQTNFESYEYPTLSRHCRLGLYYIRSEDREIGSNENEPILPWEYKLIIEGYDDESVRAWVKNETKATIAGCYRVKWDMGYDFVDKIDAYYISGWCGCSFYINEHCTDPPETSFESPGDIETTDCNSPRQHEYERYRSWTSNSLMLFKQAKRKVKSFSCYQSLPSIKIEGEPDKTISCKITLGNGGDQRPVYNEIDKANGVDLVISKEWFYDFHVFGAFRPSEGRVCERVSDYDPFKDRDGIIMRRWEVEGCTCEFFTNDKCEGNPLVRDGTSFYVNRNPPRYYQFQVIRSFRCEHFWGPPIDRQRNVHSRKCTP